MNKAFIFDMDGVIVNSESVWQRYEQKFLSDLIGKDNYFKMEDEIIGNSENVIYKILCSYGLKMNKQDFLNLYYGYAKQVYEESSVTENLEVLIEKLISMDFKLGLVSSSPQSWIDLVLVKLNMKNKFQYVLSINDAENMRPKPFPDGYIEAMKNLNVKPNMAIILEDSNKGIEAAKASGALTICLKENLPKNYKAQGADLYTKNIQELIDQIGGLL